MALPNNVLSSQTFPGPFLGGRSLPVSLTIDYETGGIALNDPSQGLMVQIWKTTIVPDEDDPEVHYIVTEPASGGQATLYTGANITECSLTFDQNMRPQLAFVEAGVAKFQWFDTQVNDQVLTIYGSSYINPRVSLDDKRGLQSNNSDVILAYMRGSSLYYRQQRDRYTVEYNLANDLPFPGIIKVGMNRKNRFQFLMRMPR